MACRNEQSMDNSQALKKVLQKFITFLHSRDQHNVKSMPTVRCGDPYEKTPANISTSNSVYSYINYRKTVDNKLAEINNNISDMLIESFKGIDNICTKVRECVSEFGHEQIYRETDKHEANDNFRNIDDESAAENLLESIHEETEKTTKTEEYESEEQENEATYSEITSAYLIESFVMTEKTCSKICVKGMEEPNLIEEKTKPRVPNFFTVVGDGTDSNNICRRVEKPEENDKIGRKINRNDKRRKLLENLRDSLKLDVENADFHHLQNLIEAVTDQIDVLGHQSRGENQLLEVKKKSTRAKAISNNQDEGLSSKISSTVEKPKCPLRIPEVYHRPAITNLHKRLLWQMEANDSFVTFQKLMRKQQKNRNSKIDSPISQINIPILSDTQSCGSQHKHGSRRNVKEDDAKGDLRFKYSDSLWFNGKKMFKVSKGQKKNVDKDKKEKLKNSTKSKSRRRSTMNINQKSPKSVTACGCSVTVTNNSPAVQNYCSTRLNWNPHKHNVQIPRRKLAYLDILDDLTNRDLLPLHSEYPRKDHLNTDVEHMSKDVHDSYLYKIMYGSKEKNTDIWNHLLQPTIECRDTDCGFCSRTNHKLEKPSTTKLQKEKRKLLLDNLNKNSSTDKTTSVSARKKRILKTLAPYMFDPQFERKENYQSLVVMPVRVFYDKDQNNYSSGAPTNLNNQKISTLPLPLVPIKESKVNRARWMNPGNLKKTVKKIDSPKPIVDQATTRSFVINKNGANFSKSEKIDSAKTLTMAYENKRFKESCEDSKDIQDISRKGNKNIVVKHPIALDERSRTNPAIARANNLHTKGDLPQKMIHKSGKTISKQLESYFKNQPGLLDGNQLMMEKYKTAQQKFQVTKVQGQVEKSDSLTSSTTARHKHMLHHLKGLKHKNDQIQNNIQKAINVIESKMVDILSSPCKSASAEAFDEMEKEINNVLEMMKFEKLPPVLEQRIVASIPEKSIDSPKLNPDLKGFKKSNTHAREKVKHEKLPDGNRKKLTNTRKFTNGKTPNDKDKSQVTEKSTVCKLEDETPNLEPEKLINEPKKMPNDALETEFNVISTDLFEKLENILYMDSHRDTSTSDIEDVQTMKYSPKNNKVDKIHSSSETTLSIDDICTKNKKHNSTAPITNSKSQILLNKNKFKRQNTKKDLPAMMVETGLAAGEMVTKGSRDQKKISELNGDKEKIKKIGDSISNFPVEPLSVFMHITPEIPYKSFSQLKDKEVIEKTTALDLDHFQSRSAPLPPTRFDCRNPSANYRETDTIMAKKFTEKCRKNEDDVGSNLDAPVPLKRLSTVCELSGGGGKYAGERSKTRVFRELDLSDAGKNITKTVDSPDDKNDKIDNNADDLEEQVNKIISRVEDIYSQLDEIQISAKEHASVPIFRDFSPKIQEIPSQEFLTPFMQAVKHSRTATKPTESYSTNTMEKSPSYYNVLSFLDTLYDIHTETVIEAYQISECNYAYKIALSTVFQFSRIEHFASLSDSDFIKELVEKPSCLKKHSGDVCKCLKPKRVSFLVMNQIQSLPAELPAADNNSDIDEIENRLDHGDSFKTNTENNNNIVIICDKRQTADVSTEMNLTTESATDQIRENLLVNSNLSISGETSETTSDLSFVTAQSTPKIKVYYNEKQNKDIFENRLEGFYNTKSIWRENSKTKPKVVIFREVNISNLAKRSNNLQKFTNTDLMMSSLEIDNNFLRPRRLPDDNKVVFLNSFYAIVYLLMFTALNMEYKCF